LILTTADASFSRRSRLARLVSHSTCTYLAFGVPLTAAQRGFSPGPKGPLVPGCEPGLRFRD
jgi:hypothetical protein